MSDGFDSFRYSLGNYKCQKCGTLLPYLTGPCYKCDPDAHYKDLERKAAIRKERNFWFEPIKIDALTELKKECKTHLTCEGCSLKTVDNTCVIDNIPKDWDINEIVKRLEKK